MKNTNLPPSNKYSRSELPATGSPSRVRLLYDLDSNGKVLKSNSILSVRTINNFGVAAVDDAREIHVIRRQDFEIVQ